MRPMILVTNDDGIESPGLQAAVEAAQALGDVLVAAPISQQTGMARSHPRTEQRGSIKILERIHGSVSCLYHAIDGSPAQAVAHAILEIASRRPALCISGINDGENLGGTNWVSGTIGAAIEAAGFGIPSVAVSLESNSALFGKPYFASDWVYAARLMRQIGERVLIGGMPPGVSVLGVNIPANASFETEVRTTSQSRHNHYMCAPPGPRDWTQACALPITCDVDLAKLEKDSDLYAFLVDRVVSVTPMRLDLTARDATGRPVEIDLGQLRNCEVF
jgi:5'-nucleotidase